MLGLRVIVLAADFVGIVSFPPKGQTILIIHPDAVTALLVSLERLQAVARRAREVQKTVRPERDNAYLEPSTR